MPKRFISLFPAVILVLLCCSGKHLEAQTLVKLDSANNVQGIGFDVPVKLQVTVHRNVHVFNVSYYEVPMNLYKKRLNGLTGVGQMGKDKNYYSQVVQLPHKAIPLSNKDVLLPVTAGGQTSYQMTLTNPVYFEPNKHYVIALTTSLADDSVYGPQLEGVMVKLLQAHQALAGNVLTIMPDEVNLFAADPAIPYLTSTQADWQQLKASFAAHPAALALLSEGAATYKQLADHYSNANGYSGIPPTDDLVVPGARNYYWVYAGIKPLLPIFNAYVQVSNFNYGFPVFAKDNCLYQLLKRQLACISCDKLLPEGGFLRDTSGFHAFLDDLLQPHGLTGTLVARLIDSLQHGSILTPANKQDDQQLQVIRSQLGRLQTITSFRTLNATGCDSLLGVKVATAAETLDSLIQCRAKVVKIQAQFIKQLETNETFLAISFYNADTYVYDLNTRYGFRLTADLGVVDYGFVPGYAYNLGQITPYAGVNFNFQYVQSNVPFSSIPGNKWYSRRHWSVLAGVSLFSVKQSNKFDNLFNKNALLVGVGYRIIPEFRLVAGTMFVKKENPDPLIGPTTGAIPFFGLSFDTNTILEGIIKYF